MPTFPSRRFYVTGSIEMVVCFEQTHQWTDARGGMDYFVRVSKNRYRGSSRGSEKAALVRHVNLYSVCRSKPMLSRLIIFRSLAPWTVSLRSGAMRCSGPGSSPPPSASFGELEEAPTKCVNPVCVLVVILIWETSWFKMKIVHNIKGPSIVHFQPLDITLCKER